MKPRPVSPTVLICPDHGPRKVYTFASPWLRADEAAAYVGAKHRCGCPSAKAFYNWRVRHGVIASRRLVAKADLDRVIRTKQQSAALRRAS